jgi:glycosyltransferase involved in cell wall biosynthesis
MRILMYGWEFPPHISGGLGVACFGMTKALAEQGHDITFVLPRLKHGTPTASHLNLLGVDHPLGSGSVLGAGRLKSSADVTSTLNSLLDKIETIEVNSPLSPYMTEKSYLEMVSRLQEEKERRLREETGFDISPIEVSGDYGPNLISEILRYAKAAGNFAAAVDHDVIHAHDWLTMLAGIEAKRISGKPLIVHIHALEFDRSGENVNQTVYDIERYGMETADQVVAVSHYTKNIIVNRYGIPENKVKVVYNAVQRKESPLRHVFKKRRKEKVVLFLGRITFQKGPDYFVEAAARVLEHRENVRFVMAGSGDMAPRLIERVAELGMGRKFHFTGFLSGQELEQIFLESDIYVMPSVSEPFGISPLEAMYFDVPVIISNQSGVAEVLTHALKFDFWDVNDLAGKILAMLDHSPLRQELMEQGARELEGFQWSKAASALENIYQTVQSVA